MFAQGVWLWVLLLLLLHVVLFAVLLGTPSPCHHVGGVIVHTELGQDTSHVYRTALHC